MLGETLEQVGFTARNHSAVFQRERSGVPVQQVPRVRSGAWSRNAFDRRSHGHCRGLRYGVSQVADWRPTTSCRQRTAPCWSRSTTATNRSPPKLAKRFHEHWDSRCTRLPARRLPQRNTVCRRNGGAQSARRTSALCRPRRERRSAVAHQHATWANTRSRTTSCLRQAAIANHMAYTTTLSAASAALRCHCSATARVNQDVRSLQEWHKVLKATANAGPAGRNSANYPGATKTLEMR